MKTILWLKRYATFLAIFLPFPFYLTANTAGAWMRRCFEKSMAARFMAADQAGRVEYYIGFIASQSGFWLPTADGYRFIDPSQRDRLGQETRWWQAGNQPVLIGRLSLWAAYRAMRRLDNHCAVRSKTLFRRSPIAEVKTPIKNLIDWLIVPPTLDIEALLQAESVRAAADRARHDKHILPDISQLGEESDVDDLWMPVVDKALKPPDVEYNWKVATPSAQATYKKAGWRGVPVKRHPELAEFKVGKQIVWHGVMLMECPIALYRDMQKLDYEIAASQITGAGPLRNC